MLHKKGQQSSLPIAPVQYTADKIVVLESGRIVESGSHDDLMSKTDEESGVYYKMVKLQQSTTNCEGLSKFLSSKSLNLAFAPDECTRVSKIKSEIKIYSSLLGLTSSIANLLQHYNFSKMGEKLTKKVREKVLSNLLTFEVGWFDQNQNTRAVVCARFSTEARMVRSLVSDRMSLLLQVSVSALITFVLALIVAWRVAIALISIQPLLIASFYWRSVLMKTISERSQKAQSEGSQLASAALINHRTITAFSSQDRILDLFAETPKGPRIENIRHSLLSGAGLFCS
ncbi:hypothetical protein T459_27723 [Capsicum annuum]|uniref:ABC transmembrane type-1 domain-containing protein n=1 Tax=Capsicum annuum TaxID=4072 RepID=A0A2G2YES0_CAPAN|nr:hypothetical protein T459_27723 [Capsicum annuum]